MKILSFIGKIILQDKKKIDNKKSKNSNESYLTSHGKTHRPEEQYRCKYCKYKHKLKPAFIAHEEKCRGKEKKNTHRPVVQYKCGFCKYKNRQKPTITEHEKVCKKREKKKTHKNNTLENTEETNSSETEITEAPFSLKRKPNRNDLTGTSPEEEIEPKLKKRKDSLGESEEQKTYLENLETKANPLTEKPTVSENQTQDISLKEKHNGTELYVDEIVHEDQKIITTNSDYAIENQITDDLDLESSKNGREEQNMKDIFNKKFANMVKLVEKEIEFNPNLENEKNKGKTEQTENGESKKNLEKPETSPPTDNSTELWFMNPDIIRLVSVQILECEFCTETFGEHNFENDRKYREHMDLIHLKKFEGSNKDKEDGLLCELCDKRNKRNITRHYYSHHKITKRLKKKGFECFICVMDTFPENKRKLFYSNEGLRIHIIRQHQTETWTHACKRCDSKFASWYALKLHYERFHKWEETPAGRAHREMRAKMKREENLKLEEQAKIEAEKNSFYVK